ncbi:hypothetical protein GCM10009533_23880 [Saccharopolyspora spinosporotrichia]|uniref:Uncharacterized protein n=1 Tax=Saccharopolyspora erythraea TaxID=1836 RepID=A0ABP3MRV7_SACER
MCPVCPARGAPGMGDIPEIVPGCAGRVAEVDQKVVTILWIETRITHRFLGYE